MRPEVAEYKRGLRQATGIDWSFKEGKMISAPTSRTLLERIIERDNIPAALPPASNTTNAQIALSLEAAAQYLDRITAERGLIAKG